MGRQLRPLSLQKGELLDQVLALPFGILPPSVDVGHPVGQLQEVCLSRISGLAHFCELTLHRATFRANLSMSPRTKANEAALSTSVFNTHFWSSLSTRVA
jgi:hypothetical protein